MEISGWTLEELANKLRMSKNATANRIRIRKIVPIFNGSIYHPDTLSEISNFKGRALKTESPKEEEVPTANATYEIEVREPPALYTADPAPAYGERPAAGARLMRPRIVPSTKTVRKGEPSVIFLDRGVVEVPVLGRTAAGQPIEPAPDPDAPTRPWSGDLIKGTGFHFDILVCGDSMMDVGIDDGDHVLIEEAEYPEHNRIMLIRHEDSSTIKRIRKIRGRSGEEEVYICWEDGSGHKEKLNGEWAIQGRIIAVEKKLR